MVEVVSGYHKKKVIESIFRISTGLKAVLNQYELFTDKNTWDHSAWTIGNGDPMWEVCIPLRIPSVLGQQE